MGIARRFGYLLLCALASASCAETIEGAATRYVDPTLGTRRATPICFAPAPAALGLAERAQYAELVDACTRGATAEGVPVNDAPGCWRASVEWTTHYAGRTELDCAFGQCGANDIYHKGVRIKVVDPSTGGVSLDMLAAINSSLTNFRPNTAFALCSAAFRGYPTPQQHRIMTIALP